MDKVIARRTLLVIAVVAALALCGANAFAQDDDDWTAVSPSSVQSESAPAPDPGAPAGAAALTRVETPRGRVLWCLIEFINSTKSGTLLAAPATSFSAAKVLFISWRITFEHRYLHTGQYRIDAVYIAPDGHTLGSVGDTQIVPPSARNATFSGRVGNSAGGAFPPGQYTVNFYLNGQYLAEKKFRVTRVEITREHGVDVVRNRQLPGGGTMDVPTLATTGRIDGLDGTSSIPLELRLRPQPNGLLHGEMVIHQAGFGATPIQGFIRGNHVEFRVLYGAKTLYFDGRRNAGQLDQLDGTFSATPSGERGTWTTVTN
jgi:hypothetical protein